MTDTKPLSIHQRFATLSSAAADLNKASDELSKAITVLDDSLQKLNLGITAWVVYLDRIQEDCPSYDRDELGYARINGKWGLAIHRITGDADSGEHQEKGSWPFNEAPREMRVLAVNAVPSLLHALTERALNTTRTLSLKVQDVRETTAAIQEVATQSGANVFARARERVARRSDTELLSSLGKPQGGKS